MNAGFEWSLHDGEWPAAAAQAVDDGLDAHNRQSAPFHEVQRLSCFVRDASRAVVGGALGRRWGLCCELQQLWVHPAQRGHGLGAALVRRFEDIAVGHGCRLFYLETWSFQAPSLYRSLGYRVVHQIEGYGPGLVKYTMQRELGA